MSARPLDRRSLLRAGAAGCLGGALAACASSPKAPSSSDDPWASLRGFSDAAVPLSGKDFAEHFAGAQAALRAAGAGAFVAEAGYTLFHLSGVRWWPSERPFLLVVRPEGAPRWIVPAFEEGRARERAGADADMLLWQEHEDPYALVTRATGSNEKIAVDPQMRQFVVAGLEHAGAEVTSGASIVRDVRATKTGAELALMDIANRATKAALARVREMTEAGRTEIEVRAWILEAQEAAGLTDVWALVLFGENAAFPHGTGRTRTLAKGDVVLVDTGGRLHGYCSDITRTWTCGSPSDEVRRAFDTVLAAQAAAFEHLSPGVPCEAADAAARAVVTEAGYGSGYDRFTHRLGHGIGLEGHEDPYLVQGNTELLRPGMTMSNEPGIYVPGRFGVRIEDILTITEDGYRVFGERAQAI